MADDNLDILVEENVDVLNNTTTDDKDEKEENDENIVVSEETVESVNTDESEEVEVTQNLGGADMGAPIVDIANAPDKTFYDYNQEKIKERIKKSKEEDKRKQSAEYKTDKNKFVDHLIDNYFKESEDGTRPAIFSGLGMDNLSSIWQEQRLGDLRKLIKNDLIESRDKYKNLTDSDLDHLINGVFDEERIKEAKEQYLPYKQAGYLDIVEGKSYDAFPNWIKSVENAEINSLSPWERDTATKKKQLSNYILENYKTLDINKDGTIDESEQTDEYKDLLEKYEKSINFLDKRIGPDKISSHKSYENGYKVFYNFATGNNIHIKAENEEEFLKSEEGKNSVDITLDMLTQNIQDAAFMAQTDHDRMRDAYGTHLLNKHGFDVKTSERMDFYTDNKAIANILSQKEGVEIVYGSLTDIEKSKLKSLDGAGVGFGDSRTVLLKNVSISDVLKYSGLVAKSKGDQTLFDWIKGKPGNPEDAGWITRTFMEGAAQNFLIPADFQIEYYDEKSNTTKKREIRNAQEYHDYLERLHTDKMDFAIRSETLKHSYLLGLDPTRLKSNYLYRLIEAASEGLVGKRSSEKTFGYSNWDIKDDFAMLANEFQIGLSDEQLEDLERDLGYQITEGIGGASGLLINLNILSKIQKGVTATTKFGKWLTNTRNATYGKGTQTFTHTEMLRKAAMHPKYGKFGDKALDVMVRQGKYKVTPPSGWKLLQNWFVGSAVTEGVKFRVAGGDFFEGMAFGGVSAGFTNLFKNVKLSKLNEWNTLANLTFKSAPSFAIASEFSHAVGAVHKKLTGEQEWETFIDEHYSDYKQFGDRVIVNLAMGKAFGATHLSRMDFASTQKIAAINKQARLNYTEVVKKGMDAPPSEGAMFDRVTGLYYTPKDYSKLQTHQDLYTTSRQRLLQMEGMDKALNPLTADKYWKDVFKSATEMYPDLKIKVDYNASNYNQPKDKMNVKRNPDGTPNTILVNPRNVPRGGVENHEIFHILESKFLEQNPNIEYKHVEELTEILKGIKTPSGTLWKLIQNEKSITSGIKNSEMYGYALEYLSRPEYYTKLVSQNAFVEIAHMMKSRAHEKGWPMPKIETKGDLINLLGSFIQTTGRGGDVSLYKDAFMKLGVAKEDIKYDGNTKENIFLSGNYGKGGKLDVNRASTQLEAESLSEISQNFYETKIKPVQTEEGRSRLAQQHYLTEGRADKMLIDIIKNYGYEQIVMDPKNVYKNNKLESGPLKDLMIDLIYDPLNIDGKSRGLLGIVESYHKHRDFVERKKVDGEMVEKFTMFDRDGNAKLNETDIVALETKYNAKRNTEEFKNAALSDGYKGKQNLNKTIINHLKIRIHEIAERGGHIQGRDVYFEDMKGKENEADLDYILFEQGKFQTPETYKFESTDKKESVENTKINFGKEFKITTDNPNAAEVISDVNPRVKNWIKETNKKNPNEITYNSLAKEIKNSKQLDTYLKDFLNIKGKTPKEIYNNLLPKLKEFEKQLYEALPNTMDLATGENTQIAKTFPFYTQSLGKLKKSETTTGITSGPQVRIKENYKPGILIDFINSKRDFSHKVKAVTDVIGRVKEMFGNQYARDLLSNPGFQQLLKNEAPKGVWETMVTENYIDNLKKQLRGPVPESVASTTLEGNARKNWRILNEFQNDFTSINFAKEENTLKAVNDLINSSREYQQFFDFGNGLRRKKLLKALEDPLTGFTVEKLMKASDAARNLGQLVTKAVVPKTFKNWKDSEFKLEVDRIFKGQQGINIAGKEAWYKNKNNEVVEFDKFHKDFANTLPKELLSIDFFRKTFGDGQAKQLLDGKYRGKDWSDNFYKDIEGSGEKLPEYFKHVKIVDNKTFKAKIEKLLNLPEFKNINHRKVREKFYNAILYGHGRLQGMLPHTMVKGKKVFSTYKQMVESNEKALEYMWGKMYDFYVNTPDAAKPQAFNNMWRLLSLQSNIGGGFFRGLATHDAISLRKGTTHSEHELQLLNMMGNGLLNLAKNSGSKTDFLNNLKPLLNAYKQSIIDKDVQAKYDDLKQGGRTGLPGISGVKGLGPKGDIVWSTDISKSAWLRNWKLAETTLDLRTGKTLADRLTDVYGGGQGLKFIQRQKKNWRFKKAKELFGIDIANLRRSEQIEIFELKDNALASSRRIDAPKKGMTASDFDYVAGITSEKVRYELPDGTKGKLNGIEFAEKYNELTNQGAKFDYTEFNDVINAKKGPFFNVIKKLKDKHGTDDIYILSARPPEAAKGIQRFFKEFGVDLKIENIIGLQDGRALAKGKWILGKIGEGYNDVLFADDIKANVDVVNKILVGTGIKGEARWIQSSTNLNSEFNQLLEATTGVGRHKRYSKAKAEVEGKKRSQYKFWIPPSAEDFVGLLYPTLAKGKVGDSQLAWYKTNLLDPYAKGEAAISKSKTQITTDYNQLKRSLKELDGKGVKGLKDNIKMKDGIESPFTKEHAIRVYNWTKMGLEIPGLSKADQKLLVNTVEKNDNLKTFADGLMLVGKGDYVKPDNNWVIGTISTDLVRSVQTNKRSKHLQEFIQNADIIFSEENLNKLESQFGKAHRSALENILDRMKTGNQRKLFQGQLGQVEGKVLDWVNNSVGSIMFLNSRSAALQLISSVNYINWSDNNVLAAGKALGNSKQWMRDFRDLYNSDFLVTRRLGNKLNIAESEIAEAVEKGGGGIEGTINYMLNKGFILTKHADSFAIAFGGASFYRNRTNTYIKQGMSKKEAEQKAFLDFKEISEVSQQSARADKISMQQASNLGRIVLAFGNTPMQYARLQKRAFQDIVDGRGDLKTNMSKIAYYGFVQNVIFNALQQAWFAIALDEDPDDQEQIMGKAGNLMNGMLDSQLRGFGYLGAGAATIKNMMYKVYQESGKEMPKYENAAWEMLDFSPPISSKIAKVRSGLRDISWHGDEMLEKGFALDNPAWGAGANITEALTNIPLARLQRKFENIENAMDEETAMWMKLALLSGWPRWQLEPRPDKKEPWETDIRFNPEERQRETDTSTGRYLPGEKKREIY